MKKNKRITEDKDLLVVGVIVIIIAFLTVPEDAMFHTEVWDAFGLDEESDDGGDAGDGAAPGLHNDTNADYCSGQVAPYTSWAEWWIAEDFCNFYQCPDQGDGTPQWCSASRDTLGPGGFACSCQPTKVGTGGTVAPNQAYCSTAETDLYGAENKAAADAFCGAYDCHESSGSCVAQMYGANDHWECGCQVIGWW